MTEEELNKQSIHSLRILGREIGVKSPTSLNKKDLISAIVKIRHGEMTPHVPVKKGRPTLASNLINVNIPDTTNNIDLIIEILVDEYRKQLIKILKKG